MSRVETNTSVISLATPVLDTDAWPIVLFCCMLTNHMPQGCCQERNGSHGGYRGHARQGHSQDSTNGGGGGSNEIMGAQESIEQRVHAYVKKLAKIGPLRYAPAQYIICTHAPQHIPAGLKYYRSRREPYLNLMLAVCPSAMKCMPLACSKLSHDLLYTCTSWLNFEVLWLEPEKKIPPHLEAR